MSSSLWKNEEGGKEELKRDPYRGIIKEEPSIEKKDSSYQGDVRGCW